MSGPNTDTRVGDLPREHAALLREIHQLAAESARLRHTMHTDRLSAADSTAVLDQLGHLDRERELTEIAARSQGIPPSWVDQARQAGQTGRAWTDEQLLGAPTRQQTGRRTVKRVIADTAQLVDMAAITAAREHLLTLHGITSEPEPAAAQQLRRNMDALWTRATRTAAAIGMSGRERARAFTITDEHVRQRTEHYLHYGLDELNAEWRNHASPAVAASVRRSLSSLRRDARTTTTPSNPDLDADLPKPAELRDRARAVLGEAVAADHAESGHATEAAIAAAMPDQLAHDLDTDASTDGGEATTTEAYRDAGPDP
ncbi:hypothetical protein [Nocardia xishanensis]|uniref:hypothetical protein n=1 Tax=Nocardia xishanensis TaxID=238964 RepID=UPI000830B268|nr:hypothetical protein [Nocardia xishanensis]